MSLPISVTQVNPTKKCTCAVQFLHGAPFKYVIVKTVPREYFIMRKLAIPLKCCIVLEFLSLG